MQQEILGKGWKVNPFIEIAGGETITIAEIEGPGAIQHIWMTPTGNWRFSILRFYWDDEKEPSVEVPVGDFFGMAFNEYAPLNSLAVTVNPGSAFNCYWKMPFRKKCKITMENLNTREAMRLYYQVDYTLTDIGEDEAYFHAQFRRSNPTTGSLHTLVDNIKGKGQYVGCYMAWNVNNNGWWGEGEIKFFMDGDTQYPTINGTGTEDYFCGSYNFENSKTKQYQEFSTAYAGLHQVIRPDGLYKSQQRLVCIAGISWIRSVLKKICGLPYRILAGGTIGGITRKNRISLPLYFGISGNRMRNFQSCHLKMILKFQDGKFILISFSAEPGNADLAPEVSGRSFGTASRSACFGVKNQVVLSRVSTV